MFHVHSLHCEITHIRPCSYVKYKHEDICVYTLFSVNRIVAVEVYKYYLNGINDILSNKCVES